MSHKSVRKFLHKVANKHTNKQANNDENVTSLAEIILVRYAKVKQIKLSTLKCLQRHQTYIGSHDNERRLSDYSEALIPAMILAGEMRAFVNFFVEAAELRFDVSAHGDEFFVLRRHLLDLLPRVTQLLRTELGRISLLYVTLQT